MTDAVDKLIQISEAPTQKEAFDVWLQMDSALAFLKDNAQHDEFVVYASHHFTFIHAALVPVSSVTPPDTDDLMSWNFAPTSSWGIEITYSQPRSISIVPPLDHTGSKTLDKGEQLVYSRHFDGFAHKKGYYEILQKFAHLFDLHFMPERNAYCRLDDRGDIEEVIRVVEAPGKGEEFGANIVTFNRDVLDEYLTLTDAAIVRMFDFTRYRPGSFSGWPGAHSADYRSDGETHYRSHVHPGYASYLRGFQLVRSLATKESVIARFDYIPAKERQYASFIAHDWKNNVVKEISCAPGQVANYFTESDLPFELSPAFFRPEVLLKYKADTDKYRLAGRSISCRGAWSLQSYDINDAGQVHTYLVYLRNLPYEEQLYWKSYNEAPKAPISKRAVTTDFEGTWDLTYDPLNSLKDVCHELHRDQVPWWTLRADKLTDRVHYPVTSSPDEWSDEILRLDQLAVEGFEGKWLRKTAESLGRRPDVAFGSLKLAEECLIALGFEDDDAKRVMAPLKEAHELRTKVKGHASGKHAVAIKKQILADHGSYKGHFRSLCEKCDQSLRSIAEAFKKVGSEKLQSGPVAPPTE